MKFKKLGSLGLATILATTAVACGGEDKPQEGNGNTGEPKLLTINNSEEPGSLNPGLAQGSHESWVIDHVMEGLYRKAVDGTIENGIAEETIVSEDGLNYTVKLKEGITWSNGDPVTAHDFEYQWKWTIDPNNRAKYAGILFIFEGAKAANAGEISSDEVQIKAVDDYTLEFTLAYPVPYFKDYMTHYTFLPVNSVVAKRNPKWYIDAQEYTSNGPFKIDEWKHDQYITLSKNESYYEADTIKLDTVKLLMMEDQITDWQNYVAGQTDMNIDLPQDILGKLIAEENEELTVEPELGTYYYQFNTQVVPYNNVKVRKALSMAMDREVITEKIAKGGQPQAYGITPPSVPDLGMGGDYQENLGPLFSYDPEEARTLLEEGLAEEGMTTAEFQPTIIYNSSEGHKKIAEAIQNMWKTDLGIDTKIENMEFQTLLERKKSGDFEVARAGWIGDYVDPMTFLEMFETGGAFNEGGWSNARYDELLDIAKNTSDDVIRFDAYREAEAILMDEMVVAPIYFYTKGVMTKPYVTGVFKPVNRYPSFKYADIQK